MTPSPAFSPQAVVAGCELCEHAGGTLLWSDAGWRVVRVADPAFPAFYRVVCNHHVAEFSELLAPERQRCMDLVCAVERVLVERLAPTKINLAALGNMVPHLHWHVVARFDWDSHFPQPIWGTPQRTLEGPAEGWLGMCLSDLDEFVVAAVAGT
ncbi:MAG TPA: HIT family protein [Albitalea sp.]|uniref:HIT family protein n=1 Tax=Piscinibacter sp. TaxID=1903157 RepID=UPI002ED585E5